MLWSSLLVLTARLDLRKMLPNPERVEANFNERLAKWKTQITVQCLQEVVGLSAGISQEIEVLPAGRFEFPFLFKGHRPWLSHLWLASVASY